MIVSKENLLKQIKEYLKDIPYPENAKHSKELVDLLQQELAQEEKILLETKKALFKEKQTSEKTSHLKILKMRKKN